MEMILKIWDSGEKFMIGVFGFFIATITFYGVVMRYIFESAPEWTEEIVIYMAIWAAYIAGSNLVREDGHVGVTFFVNKFLSKYDRIIGVITGFVALGFLLIVTYYGFIIVKAVFLTGEKGQSSIRFPMWIPILSVPVGSSLMSLGYLIRIYRILFHPDHLSKKKES